MITDSQTTFSQGQTIAATGTTDSTNFIDLSAVRDVGSGEPLYVLASVATTFTQTGTGTVTAELISDTSATFANNPQVLLQTTTPIANMTVGSAPLVAQQIPIEAINGRYLKMSYIVNGGTVTAGAVSAEIVLDIQNDEYYPSGINVAGI